jgi:hypothetical protein
MSHYTRMVKSGESVVRKGGWFSSGDTGAKDAGASQANSVQPSMTSHLHSIADRHSTESGMHSDVAEKLGWMGMDKQSAAHRSVADEHSMAAGHYRAAAHAASDDRSDDVASHLKSARASAASAESKTKAMMA